MGREGQSGCKKVGGKKAVEARGGRGSGRGVARKKTQTEGNSKEGAGSTIRGVFSAESFAMRTQTIFGFEKCPFNSRSLVTMIGAGDRRESVH